MVNLRINWTLYIGAVGREIRRNPQKSAETPYQKPLSIRRNTQAKTPQAKTHQAKTLAPTRKVAIRRSLLQKN